MPLDLPLVLTLVPVLVPVILAIIPVATVATAIAIASTIRNDVSGSGILRVREVWEVWGVCIGRLRRSNQSLTSGRSGFGLLEPWNLMGGELYGRGQYRGRRPWWKGCLNRRFVVRFRTPVRAGLLQNVLQAILLLFPVGPSGVLLSRDRRFELRDSAVGRVLQRDKTSQTWVQIHVDSTDLGVFVHFADFIIQSQLVVNVSVKSEDVFVCK